MAWSSPSTVITGDLITAAVWNQNVVANTIALLPVALEFFIDGGDAVIQTGWKGVLESPFKGDIDRCTLLLDQAATLSLDIWRDTYANYPPTNADTITGANEPATAAADKDQDSTLTAWTTAFAAGDIFGWNVDANDAATWCLASLKCSRS